MKEVTVMYFLKRDILGPDRIWWCCC